MIISRRHNNLVAHRPHQSPAVDLRGCYRRVNGVVIRLRSQIRHTLNFSAIDEILALLDCKVRLRIITFRLVTILEFFSARLRMPNLSNIEKRKIEKLLEMGSGYVLDFSNRTFQEFVIDSVGIDIYDEKYAYSSGSKANRLRALWDQESGQVVGKLILDLLEYWKTQKLFNDVEISQVEQGLYNDCSKIPEGLMQTVVEEDSSPAKTVTTLEKAQIISILLLSADPTNASRLRIGEELREIQEKLQLARLREKFILNQRMSVRPTDISQALLDAQPHIVHFSGHGEASGELCFEDRTGKIHPIVPDALAALFEQFTDQVSCVLLNSCYSEIQAVAIAKHIDYVIGMNQAIGDHAAIAFAIGFYQALGAGRTIEEAYKLGCVQIRLQSIPEHLTPVLIQKGESPVQTAV
jgi:hypothetical protein